MTGINLRIISEMTETKRIIDSHPLEMPAALFQIKVRRYERLNVIVLEREHCQYHQSGFVCESEEQARKHVTKIAYQKAAEAFKAELS